MMPDMGFGRKLDVRAVDTAMRAKFWKRSALAKAMDRPLSTVTRALKRKAAHPDTINAMYKALGMLDDDGARIQPKNGRRK